MATKTASTGSKQRSPSIGKLAGARRDFTGMEERRRRAGRMFAKGATQAEVARALGVSIQSAHRWYHAWRTGGVGALKAAGRAGRRPRLSGDQRRAVERALLKGATANGFPTDLWTLDRVGVVIERITGIGYHRGHVWKILRQMGWSLQRPARRAAERDEDKVTRWVKERWPRVKKTPGGGGRG